MKQNKILCGHHWKPKTSYSFWTTAIINNHEISGLGILLQKRLIVMASLADRASVAFENTLDYVVDELHENTKIRCHEALNLSSLVGLFSAYPYSDDELHAKTMTKPNWFLNRGDFGKEGNFCMPASRAAPFTPTEEHQTFVRTSFTNKCWPKWRSTMKLKYGRQATKDTDDYRKAVVILLTVGQQSWSQWRLSSFSPLWS